MCGIAGLAGRAAADEAVLRAMCDAIAHRGPDDEGYLFEPGHVGLGFRRLSIIDLATGAQPIADESGRRHVTCNGEIYNFQELREGLRARGHEFSSGSDCETLVHLYEERGTDFLEELRGMFAIALWDAERRRLVLARDRLGVKPLYYAEVDGGLVYGSEPAAILASGLVPAVPDPEAIVQYLALQYVPPPLSGFRGIRKLFPGERLVWEDGRARVERWWRLSHAPKRRVSDDEALAEVDDLVREATRLRMIADVPLGAFLSGGIDSSIVVSYMAELSTDVHTFSIDFPHARFSEGPYAKEVAGRFGTVHEEFTVEPDMVPVVADAVRYAGEPFADSSAVPTYLLSEMTRRHVTVALSGDGGDEGFAGYVRHRVAAQADRLGPLTRLAGPLAAAGRLLPAHHRVDRIVRGLGALARGPHDRYAWTMSIYEPAAIEALCEPGFLAEGGGSRFAWDEVLTAPDGLKGVDRYAALDVDTYLPGDLLTKVDRMSMAHALEVRSPLLDHKLHELAITLPRRMKLRRGTTKWLLRELALRRGVPATIVNRPKMGFGIPIGEWFRGELRGWTEDVLLDPRTAGRGYFHQEEVERMLREHTEGRATHTYRLWSLLMLEVWHRAWIDGAARDGLAATSTVQ